MLKTFEELVEDIDELCQTLDSLYIDKDGVMGYASLRYHTPFAGGNYYTVDKEVWPAALLPTMEPGTNTQHYKGASLQAAMKALREHEQ